MRCATAMPPGALARWEHMTGKGADQRSTVGNQQWFGSTPHHNGYIRAGRSPELSTICISSRPRTAQPGTDGAERWHAASPASRSSHRWSTWLLALVPRRPGRGRRRPARAGSQLLDHDLDDGPGAAILSGPASPLESATTTTRLLGEGQRGMLGLIAPHDHGDVSTGSRAGMRSETAVPDDARKQLRSKDTLNEHFRSSRPAWWAWEDLNLRPHPERKIARVMWRGVQG
jgi:hypothetical protein